MKISGLSGEKCVCEPQVKKLQPTWCPAVKPEMPESSVCCTVAMSHKHHLETTGGAFILEQTAVDFFTLVQFLVSVWAVGRG